MIEYHPKYNVNIKLFKSNPLFRNGDEVCSEDLINGKLDKTLFAFYEAHYTDHGSDGVIDRFQGLVFMADFNKNFSGVTTISYGRPGNCDNLKKLTMEAGDFSKMFDVYSSDEQNARYIISPAFMERILELNEITRKMRNDSISVVFRDSNMEVYLPSKKDRFEASVFTEMKPEDVSSDFEVLEKLLSLIDVMMLNVRIWTKE